MDEAIVARGFNGEERKVVCGARMSVDKAARQAG
jgi:hypothetical protein